MFYFILLILLLVLLMNNDPDNDIALILKKPQIQKTTNFIGNKTNILNSESS